MSRYLLVLFSSFLLVCCCDDDGEGNTHFLKGKIQHAISEDPIPDIVVNVDDRNCPFSFGASCKDLQYNIKSNTEGDFDFTYKSCCDAVVKFRLDDDMEKILGKCYRWKFQDLNNNQLQLGACGSEKNLMTVRALDYNFLIEFQPQLFLRFIAKENPDLEFKMIEVEQLGIAQDSLNNINDFYDISKLKDELEIKVIYANDSIIIHTLEYDHLINCREEIAFEI